MRRVAAWSSRHREKYGDFYDFRYRFSEHLANTSLLVAEAL